MPKWKVWLFRLAMVFFSTVGTLALCEVLVRIIAPQDYTGTWYENSPHGANINKANWVSRHQVGQRVIQYRLNDLHLRGGPIGNGAHRVLCLGDSFTFGYLVAEPDTFVNRLGELAKQDFPGTTFEFLNGGVSGAGTGDMVLFTEDFAPRIRPEAIVIFLNNDDVERTVGTKLFQLEGDAVSQVVWAPKPSFVKDLRERLRRRAVYQWLLEHSALVEVVRTAVDRKMAEAGRTRAVQHTPAEDQANVRMVEGLFLRLQHWCDQNHCRLLVVTTGYNNFPDYPFGWNDGNANGMFFKEAAGFFERSQIPFHDLGPELSAAVHGDFNLVVIPNDLHPNERGNELIAGLAWPWLRSQLQTVLKTNAAIAVQ